MHSKYLLYARFHAILKSHSVPNSPDSSQEPHKVCIIVAFLQVRNLMINKVKLVESFIVNQAVPESKLESGFSDLKSPTYRNKSWLP